MDVLHNLPQLVTAIGGLGTAAFGLVDATKVFGGGVNHVGFRRIAARVAALTPGADQSVNALPQKEVLNTLKGNWFNGTDLGSQKAIAKSLIKLHLNSSNAAAVAKATNLDSEAFGNVIAKQTRGESLLPAEGDLFARFDLVITAMLDEAYQIADQLYCNAARALAVVFAVALSFAGCLILHHDGAPVAISYSDSVIIGLLATPLAPIAKDLSSALAAAVNALQSPAK
jgi:hypothetical protein